jgi:hypothetical protein
MFYSLQNINFILAYIRFEPNIPAHPIVTSRVEDDLRLRLCVLILLVPTPQFSGSFSFSPHVAPSKYFSPLTFLPSRIHR